MSAAPHRAGTASAVRAAGPPVIAPLAFVFSTELLYWAKWPLTGEIILLMVVALPVYFYYQAKRAGRFRPAAAGRVVADRLPAGDRARVLGRQRASSAGTSYIPLRLGSGWSSP